MTYTEISEMAGERLTELNQMPTVMAVSKCLDVGSKKISTSSKDLIKWIQEETSVLPPIAYFQEATIAKPADPIKTAERRLKNGFNTNGKNIDLNSPPIWDSFVNETRNLRYKMHSWVMLDTLLSADEVFEGDHFLLKAVSIADDWIKNFIISGRKDEFAWYDMAVGQRSTKLPYMLRRLIEIGAEEELIYHFIIASEIHVIELSQEERIATHSNHGLFQMAGLIALVKSIPWLEKSAASYIFAKELLLKMLNEHFGGDGLHKEHSPEYHFFMINHLSSFQQSGWLDDFQELIQLIEGVEQASHWMQNPERNVIVIGDSKNNLPATERWSSINKNIEEGLKVFPIGGLAIENIKQDKKFSQLLFSAQFHSRQHKHSDHLNILYHLNGKPLLVDAGTYTYQYDLPERIYCESTRAHNTVEIDGLNFSRFRKDAFGSALTFAMTIGPCTILRGQVHHKRLISPFIPNNKITMGDGIDTDVIHKRTIIHYPGRFLAIIDQLDSSKTHDYIQWNHFAPEYEIQKNKSGRYAIYNSKKELECTILTADDKGLPLDSITIRGQTQPHLQGWISHNGRELIENVALGFSTTAKNNSFVTIFDFDWKNTKKPYLRTGSKGKYLRFSLTQNNSKVDIKIRIGVDNLGNIEAVIDGKEYTDEIKDFDVN